MGDLDRKRPRANWMWKLSNVHFLFDFQPYVYIQIIRKVLILETHIVFVLDSEFFKIEVVW